MCFGWCIMSSGRRQCGRQQCPCAAVVRDMKEEEEQLRAGYTDFVGNTENPFISCCENYNGANFRHMEKFFDTVMPDDQPKLQFAREAPQVLRPKKNQQRGPKRIRKKRRQMRMEHYFGKKNMNLESKVQEAEEKAEAVICDENDILEFCRSYIQSMVVDVLSVLDFNRKGQSEEEQKAADARVAPHDDFWNNYILLDTEERMKRI